MVWVVFVELSVFAVIFGSRPKTHQAWYTLAILMPALAVRHMAGIGSRVMEFVPDPDIRSSLSVLLLERGECEKGIWWMPWRREAMKDVARCEKPGGGASTL